MGEEPCVITTLSCLVASWDSELAGRKATPMPAHAFSRSHSLHYALLVCPLTRSWVCSSPLTRAEIKESTFHCWGFAFSLRITSLWVFFPVHVEDSSLCLMDLMTADWFFTWDSRRVCAFPIIIRHRIVLLVPSLNGSWMFWIVLWAAFLSLTHSWKSGLVSFPVCISFPSDCSAICVLWAQGWSWNIIFHDLFDYVFPCKCLNSYLTTCM